ncbi:MAG: AAA family ATPase [Holosporaceae bacterium]|nr:MAG: AAA family ATPase [Holosporaceae bacterium]
MKKEKVSKEATTAEIQSLIADEIEKVLQPHQKELKIDTEKKPYVMIMAGVNGSGKTTTCAKVGWQLKEQGLQVRLAACDTFRAAAVEQLAVWADRLHIPLSKGTLNTDPASLAFDAYKEAEKEGADVLIIDTAGRLHTNQNLMAELEKNYAGFEKINPNLPTKFSLCSTQLLVKIHVFNSKPFRKLSQYQD